MDLLSRGAAALLLTLSVACTPEIGRGTYFCGPERFCPPGQECNDSTFTCETPVLVEDFECPEMSEIFEPDDVASESHDVGALACGEAAIELSRGCIPDKSDADYVVFEHQADCTGARPHLSVMLDYPVALVPIEVELLDEDENVIAEGEICTEGGDFTGKEKLCLEAEPPHGTYYVRVSSDEEAPDCEGECHYNQYTLAIRFPLS